MWMDRLLASPTSHALELAARFSEARQQVLAENAANLSTPRYQTRSLDPQAFRRQLKQALASEPLGGDGRLVLEGPAQARTDAGGGLTVTPSLDRPPNALFGDGTNARMEDLMAGAQENALDYRASMQLLRGKFDSLLNAIRGRNT
jgi:flagellar basal-body rod protein FlgB